MTELAPGVYVKEVSSGSAPIRGVATSTAAFIGFVETDNRGLPEGERNRPHLVTSWDQYVRDFGNSNVAGGGGFSEGAYLAHAVKGFFDNCKGGRCYIVRLQPAEVDRAPLVEVPPKDATGPDPLLTLTQDIGDTSEYIVEIEDTPFDEGGRFDFRLFRDGVAVEDLSGQSLSSLQTRLKAGGLVTASITRPPKSKPKEAAEDDDVPPLIAVDEVVPAPLPTSYRLQNDLPVLSNVSQQDIAGSADDRTGLGGLDSVIRDIQVLAFPDLAAIYQNDDGSVNEKGFAMAQKVIADWGAKNKKMVILDPPNAEIGPQAMAAYTSTTLGSGSPFATMYYPWVRVPNPDTSEGAPLSIPVPPAGHIAGVWASTDARRGVWKAPANELLAGAPGGLAFDVTRGERELLNPLGVNAIVALGSRGTRVYGARTLEVGGEWTYVPVRRLFNYVMQSVEEGTEWAVFEPNDKTLWEKLKRNLFGFLRDLWRQGALFGSSPSEAFYIKIDEGNNPESERAKGRLNIEIGIAPVKPAEFVVISISQWSQAPNA